MQSLLLEPRNKQHDALQTFSMPSCMEKVKWYIKKKIQMTQSTQIQSDIQK